MQSHTFARFDETDFGDRREHSHTREFFVGKIPGEQELILFAAVQNEVADDIERSRSL